MALTDGFFSLMRGRNTTQDGMDETQEGIKGPLQQEAEFDLSGKDLITLKKKWELKWEPFAAELSRKQEESENYWLGKQHSNIQNTAGSEQRPMVDNVVFESLETFLPIATKRNPEPQVSADETPEGEALADRVQKMLVYQADRLRMKLKLKRVTRYWALYFLGAIKVGWSEVENDISMSVIRTKRLILDPEATIDEGIYTGEYIGEVKRESASRLVKRFPKKSEMLEKSVDGKMGTILAYTEWWTNDLVFWTLKNEFLGKSDNPHWNKPEENVSVDETGQELKTMKPGNNHFSHPMMPYIFLSVFNIGKHPYDDTSLIHQNLSNQDIINKRNRQIDRNADNANTGLSVSGDHFTQEQAALAAESLRKGGVLWVPSGDVRSAVSRDAAPPLARDIFTNLVDMRQRLLDIFGTRGSSPTGLLDEKTVRGKIINRASDESRIGGGISEYLEQVADITFNWFVQLMYVYYDETHYGSVLGAAEGKVTVALSNLDFNRKITISVKEGSLVPKDDVSRANQAVDLAGAGKMSLVDLYEVLEYPNAQEMATRAWLEINAPHLLYGQDPLVMQAVQEKQALEQLEAQAKAPQGGGKQSAQPKQPKSPLAQVPIPQ